MLWIRTTLALASTRRRHAGRGEEYAGRAEQPARPPKSFDDLAGDTAEWWHGFWQRGTIALQARDGTADEVAANYHYGCTDGLHLARRVPTEIQRHALEHRRRHAPVGCTSTGSPTSSCYYEALFAANRIDLLDPVFSMLSSGMFNAASTAAPSNGAVRASTFQKRSGTTGSPGFPMTSPLRCAICICYGNRGRSAARSFSNTRAPVIRARADGTGGSSQ